jgi:hypothetical protein
LIQRLQNARVSAGHQKEFHNIIKFMQNGAGLDGSMLRMKIADLDQKRQQNLCKVQPEFASLLEYTGP